MNKQNPFGLHTITPYLVVEDVERLILFLQAGSRYFCESLFWASQPKQAAKT